MTTTIKASLETKFIGLGDWTLSIGPGFREFISDFEKLCVGLDSHRNDPVRGRTTIAIGETGGLGSEQARTTLKGLKITLSAFRKMAIGPLRGLVRPITINPALCAGLLMFNPFGILRFQTMPRLLIC